MIDSKLQKFNNLSIHADAQNDPNTSTSVIAIAEKILIPIDEDIANRHGINDGDLVSLVEEGIGRITLIFKDTKNKVGRKLPSNQPTIEGGYPT